MRDFSARNILLAPFPAIQYHLASFRKMRVNAQAFFNFCSGHVPLLRALAECSAEVSEAEASRIIRAHPTDELPETAWRRLKDYQIMVPLEPGSEMYLLAEPVKALLAYLFDEATPTTPEVIRGYVQSLEVVSKRLSRALDGEEITIVELAFAEINQTLRRIFADLEATHQSVLLEVAQFKTTRQKITVREKYRRIVYWMERFVEPMIEVIRADGPMRAAFDEVERLLSLARQRALFNDVPTLERNLRYLRLIGHHALRIFQQCRKEIQPLYESLRRSSFLAEGAAKALESLQREGIARWGTEPLMGICAHRFVAVPGDAAIANALRRVIEHKPEPPPVVSIAEEDPAPSALVRRLWLDGLESRARADLPLPDLLAWLSASYPEKETAQILSGFTRLLFHEDFRGSFSDDPPRTYELRDGELEAPPVRLIAK